MVASGSEMAGTAAAAPRFLHIDALRGIAALLVVWLHVTQFFQAQLAPVQPMGGLALARFAQDFDFGRIGVMLFFLISGYVIPDSIRLDRPSPLATFAIRRVLRIFPAYWLSVPLGAGAMWWLWGRPFGWREILVNLTLLQDLVGVPPAIGVYWTLLVELVFYVLCIVLALLHSLHDARRIAWLAALLAGVHTLAVFAAWRGVALSLPLAFLPLYLPFMLCGALFRHLDDGAAIDAGARRLLAALVGYYLVVFPLAASWAIGPRNNYVVCGAIALLVFLLGTRVTRLRAGLFVWLGRISYSLYLFHAPLTMLVLWWLLQQAADSPWRGQHMLVYLAACTLLGVAAAAVVERCVERPGIALGRWLATRWQQRAAARLR